jgi:hypothetical protein
MDDVEGKSYSLYPNILVVLGSYVFLSIFKLMIMNLDTYIKHVYQIL